MKYWMVTYINEIGSTRKIWFREKTLIHAYAIARKLKDYLPEACGWTIVDVERRY